MPKRTKAFIALFIVSAIWGIAAVVIKQTLNYIPPITFLYIRFLFASIILYFFVDWKKSNYKKIIKSKKFIYIFLLGVLGSTVNLGLIFYALKYTTAIEGTIIYAANPIWIIIGGMLFLKEKVTKKEILGIMLTLVGFALVVLSPMFHIELEKTSSIFGNFLMLLAALSWAAYSLLSKNVFNHDKTGKRYSPMFITFITFFAGAVTLAPFSIYEILTTEINYIASFGGIFYMVIFSSVIAYWLYEYGVQKMEVSEAGLFQYIEPLFTIPVAIIFIGERFYFVYIIGGIITALGLYVAEKHPSVRFSK